MRYGVPIIGDRVAPRCIYADGFVVIDVSRRRPLQQYRHDVAIRTPADLTDVLTEYNIDTLITGGVGRTVRNRLADLGISIVDNVSQTLDALVHSVADAGTDAGSQTVYSDTTDSPPCGGADAAALRDINCIDCPQKQCLRGVSRFPGWKTQLTALSREERRIIEAAFDVSSERHRQLCRLAEVVYFCLEMGYGRIGLAYCTDLEDAAAILTTILKRFFSVVPVCCKVGGIDERTLFKETVAWRELDKSKVVCNPIGQARVLNAAETEFNIIVGLCVGMDAIFTRAADAPATTLFVKDKSLANNPIGALYSEYYLKETVERAVLRPSSPSNINRSEET